MTKHFRKELENIKKRVLSLGAMAEDRVHLVINAIDAKDADIAEQIIKQDFEIDEIEVEIEEECLKVLALHQPVAVDLRFLTAVIKINNDLERIGDEAVNIAEHVDTIARHTTDDFHFDYSPMAEKAAQMLKQSLDALVNLEVDTAFKVVFMDDEVDRMQMDAFEKMKAAIQKHPEHVDYLTSLLFISRHLERIADHATNIAEEVIYLIEGEIVRHSAY